MTNYDAYGEPQDKPLLWRYMDCDISASGTAIMALGGATGHVWMPVAFFQDKDVAEVFASAVNAMMKQREVGK